MREYEILEHTGDAKIRCFGKTKEILFVNALCGMNAILRAQPAHTDPRAPKTQHIRIRSKDANALLVDFLNEINYLRQINMEVYDTVTFSRFSDTQLAGEISGHSVWEFGEDIKAVTFHGLDIHKNKQGEWEATIIFDI